MPRGPVGSLEGGMGLCPFQGLQIMQISSQGRGSRGPGYLGNPRFECLPSADPAFHISCGP